jgi:hypothetical protein
MCPAQGKRPSPSWLHIICPAERSILPFCKQAFPFAKETFAMKPLQGSIYLPVTAFSVLILFHRMSIFLSPLCARLSIRVKTNMTQACSHSHPAISDKPLSSQHQRVLNKHGAGAPAQARWRRRCLRMRGFSPSGVGATSGRDTSCQRTGSATGAGGTTPRGVPPACPSGVWSPNCARSSPHLWMTWRENDMYSQSVFDVDKD